MLLRLVAETHEQFLGWGSKCIVGQKAQPGELLALQRFSPPRCHLANPSCIMHMVQ
jgi:hypothetical protein